MVPPGLHALIIEDDFLFAWRLEDLLRGLGFDSFAIASTVIEAFASAEEQRPALITADLRLSDGSGLEAVEAIHARIDPSIPVVFITADAEELADLAGAVVVAKPISAAALKRACGAALHGLGVEAVALA